MPTQRRNFTGAEKLAILRQHLLEHTPICDVCQKHDIQPTLCYLWQKNSADFDELRRRRARFD